MKIQRNRFTKRNLLIIGLPLFVILLGAGAYGYYRWSQSKASVGPTNSYNKTDYNPPTDDQKQAGQDIKNNTVNNPSGKPAAPGTDGTAEPAPGSTIPVTITAANQNGNILSLRSLIETVTSSGTCTLTLTKGSVVVTKTSGIQALANSSTCQGFDIPTSEISAGQWHIQLKVVAGDKTGTASKDVTVQ